MVAKTILITNTEWVNIGNGPLVVTLTEWKPIGAILSDDKPDIDADPQFTFGQGPSAVTRVFLDSRGVWIKCMNIFPVTTIIVETDVVIQSQTSQNVLFTVRQLQMDTGIKTAVATAGAATLNKSSGTITTEDLTTVSGDQYVLTLTNDDIAATDLLFTSVSLGSATTGTPIITTTEADWGQAFITVQNIHASDAFNGSLIIAYMLLKGVA